MEHATFFDRTVGHIRETYGLTPEMLDVARLSAEGEVGVSVALLGDSDKRLRWLENRVKYQLFSMLYEQAARKYDADDARMSQRFAHFRNVLEHLREEWERDIAQHVRSYHGSGTTGIFDVIEPVFHGGSWV